MHCVKALGILGISVFSLSFLNAAQAEGANKKPVVFTDVAKIQEASESLIYPAQVSSSTEARFFAEGDGLVTRIQHGLGTRVRRGETVMVVQNTDPAFSYAPMQVRASVTGVVASLDVTEGSQVARGQILGTLTDPKKLRICIEIPASDLSKIKIGLEANFVLPVAGSTPTKLTISNLAPAIDSLTGTAKAELKPANTELKSANTETKSANAALQIVPGQLGRVEIKTAPRMAFLVTQDAVIYKEGEKFLRLVEGGKAKFSKVTLGRVHGENVEIESGLKAGDQVILRASGFVANGQEVEIYKPEAPEAAKPSSAVQAR